MVVKGSKWAEFDPSTDLCEAGPSPGPAVRVKILVELKYSSRLLQMTRLHAAELMWNVFAWLGLGPGRGSVIDQDILLSFWKCSYKKKKAVVQI